MSMALRVTGVHEVRKAFSKAERALNTTTLSQHMGEVLLQRIKKRFKAQVGPEGESWPPLKKTTVLDRLQKGFGAAPILYRTGSLYASIRLVKSGKGVAVKTGKPYAAALQFGADGMPARPFLGVGSSDVDAITKAVRSRVARVWG